MFSKTEFQTWGKQNAVLFAAVMTKIDGRENDELLRTYEFRGFPSMAILDADGEAITKEVPRDLFSMQNIVAAAPVYARLAAAVENGDDVDEKAWLMAQIGMGKISAEEAKSEIESVGLTGADKQKAEQIVFVMEMGELAGKARGRNATAEDKMAACVAVYEAFKAGKRLPPGASPEAFVDEMLIDAAKDKGDKAAFAHAYDRVKAGLVERVESLEGMLPRFRADLEKNKDNEQLLARTKSTLERLESMIGDAKKELVELEALAKKLKG